jgi:hypothetical protein
MSPPLGAYYRAMNTASSGPVSPTPSRTPSTTTEQAAAQDESTTPPEPPFTGCRSGVKWVTRILSLPLILTCSIVMIQAVFSGDYPGKSDMVAMLFVLPALLIAWRWEMVGGALFLLGTSVNAYVTKMHEEPWGFYIGWMFAFLFLVSGALKTAVSPAASQRAIKTARILALVFALLALASLAGCFGSGAYKKFNG